MNVVSWILVERKFRVDPLPVNCESTIQILSLAEEAEDLEERSSVYQATYTASVSVASVRAWSQLMYVPKFSGWFWLPPLRILCLWLPTAWSLPFAFNYYLLRLEPLPGAQGQWLRSTGCLVV